MCMSVHVHRIAPLKVALVQRAKGMKEEEVALGVTRPAAAATNPQLGTHPATCIFRQQQLKHYYKTVQGDLDVPEGLLQIIYVQLEAR